MLPGNVDPRRPDKVQRYIPKTSNGSGQEDLTPDYMNILGQHATTANAAAEVSDKHAEASVSAEPNLQVQPHLEEVDDQQDNGPAVTCNATNVIPTSPQYGVAIIPNATTLATNTDLPTETITSSTDTVTDTTAKPPDDNKDLHSTPSRNDRFKVVKIASLEPFKRGRWKCMDYVDEAPPTTTQQSKVTQSTGSLQVAGAAAVYLQTQSLPQQQIQQMLLQGGFTNGQFFQNVPTQIIQPAQYFYPQVTNMQTQTLQQQVPSSMPAQYINSAQQYFPAGVVPNTAGFTMPQSYQNVQYVPTNIIQNQNSAFVPTSQTVQLPSNFQQSQTYAGQPNVTQTQQPLVNGHAFPPQQQNEQVTSSSLPTQTAKSVILNNNVPQPVVSQTQITQPNVQNQIPVQNNTQSQQSVPVIQNQQQYSQPNSGTFQQPLPNQQTQPQSNVIQAPTLIQVPQMVQVQTQNFDQNLASNVYTNPQFAMSVNSLSVLEENAETSTENVAESGNSAIADPPSENSDDPAKTNPVVNAIDNKIEQAMDLVKSHLMYTVREEVEVLKEKIAELMEKIQQLETENNYLRSQIPKNQNAAPTPTSNTNPVNNSTSSQTNAAPVTTPSPNPSVNTQNPTNPSAETTTPQQ